MRCNHGSPTQVPGGPVLPVVLVHGAVRPVRRSSWHYEKPRAGEFRLPAARTQTPPKAGLLTSPEESQADLLRLPKFERIAREKIGELFHQLRRAIVPPMHKPVVRRDLAPVPEHSGRH